MTAGPGPQATGAGGTGESVGAMARRACDASSRHGMDPVARLGDVAAGWSGEDALGAGDC